MRLVALALGSLVLLSSLLLLALRPAVIGSGSGLDRERTRDVCNIPPGATPNYKAFSLIDQTISLASLPSRVGTKLHRQTREPDLHAVRRRSLAGLFRALTATPRD
jgi:hypothetical protein